MGCTIVSSREFNQDVSRSKRDALKGPVFITDRGRTAHVLLSISDYRKIADRDKNIVDLLAMPEAAEIDFVAPSLEGELYNPADFS